MQASRWQCHDSQPEPCLSKDVQAKVLMPDRRQNHDSDKLLKQAQVQDMRVIIPSRARPKQPRPLDKQRYDDRYLT